MFRISNILDLPQNSIDLWETFNLLRLFFMRFLGDFPNFITSYITKHLWPTAGPVIFCAYWSKTKTTALLTNRFT